MRPDQTVTVVPDFISAKERDQLEKLTLGYMETGVLKENGVNSHRFNACVNGVNQGTYDCDFLIKKIGSRVIRKFGLKGFPVDPYLGWVVSLIQPGGFVHLHTDNFEHYKKTTDKHLRCNVLVSMENDTYRPVINNCIIPIKTCGLWGFFPSDAIHGTQVISGTTPRINFQFGFTVPGDYELKTPEA